MFNTVKHKSTDPHYQERVCTLHSTVLLKIFTTNFPSSAHAMNKSRYIKSFKPLINDEIMLTELLHDLGGPRHLRFELAELLDVAAASIQKPLGAIVTLVTSDAYDEERDQEEERIDVEWSQRQDRDSSIQLVPQTVDNACGMISVLNLALNLGSIRYGSFLPPVLWLSLVVLTQSPNCRRGLCNRPPQAFR